MLSRKMIPFTDLPPIDEMTGVQLTIRLLLLLAAIAAAISPIGFGLYLLYRAYQ